MPVRMVLISVAHYRGDTDRIAWQVQSGRTWWHHPMTGTGAVIGTFLDEAVPAYCRFVAGGMGESKAKSRPSPCEQR